MVVFPNCKINIGLHILGKRADGYHNLETVFYPVPLKDALELIRLDEPADTDCLFSQTGIPVAGDPSSNLCVKAYQLLKKDFPDLPKVKIHLHKAIPMGAGLGGGSADGAFTLLLLDKQFRLGLTEEQLLHYALQLGSDCPFFIYNKACFAAGRGEQLEPLEISLKGYGLLLINPGIHINTGWAFQQLNRPAHSDTSITALRSLVQRSVHEWRQYISNDFEAAVFKAHPIIEQIKNALYDQGAVYAAMSGSGSTLFGLYEPGIKMQIPAIAASFFNQSLTLQ